MQRNEGVLILRIQFSLEKRIGDIVAELPLASEVFRKHGIDFCCGGSRPLREALAEKNLDAQVVLRDLDEAKEKAKALTSKQDWRMAPLTDLVEYVVNHHHGYLRRVLPEVSDLTTTILRVHGPNHPELSQVHRLFHLLKMELEQHLILEEEMFFPFVKAYESTESNEALERAVDFIEQVEREHDGAGNILKELRIVTKDYWLPEDACTTFAKTYEKLAEIESDLFEHIHLENNILHPRLEKLFHEGEGRVEAEVVD